MNLNHSNPFDQIKHIDDSGLDYWLARELMPILGYKQWRRFEDTVQRAIVACNNVGNDSKEHFLPTLAKSTGGRSREDFNLSRYACYVIAMNGDPRKKEIAAAQNYFAIKTREAETLARENHSLILQLIKRFEEQDEKIAKLQSQVNSLLVSSTDFIPPGWNKQIWVQLPAQDKRHFRFLYRKRQFKPSNQGTEAESVLPQLGSKSVKKQQQAEIEQWIRRFSDILPH